MDYFESLTKTVLEQQGYWVRQSYKVDLTPKEKANFGKPTMPRPEIDILAFKPRRNEIVVIEAKSFLDSSGVRFEEMKASFDVPTGRYKLFTCEIYRETVLDRLKVKLVEQGLATSKTKLTLGLAAGKVYRDMDEELGKYMNSKGWKFFSPQFFKVSLGEFSKKSYENEPSFIISKLLLRD